MELSSNILFSDAALKGYYKLENSATTVGSTALTSIGTVSYSAGKYGLGADFGIDNNCLYADTNFSTTYSDPKSMTSWFIPHSQPSDGDWHTIAVISYATGDVFYYMAYYNNSGTMQIRFTRDRYNVAATNSLYTVTLTNDVPYFVVMTYDGSNIKGYLNGSLVAGPTAASGTGNNGAPDRVVIGGGVALNERFGRCTSDDTAFFSKELSAAEILSLYNERAPSFVTFI